MKVEGTIIQKVWDYDTRTKEIDIFINLGAWVQVTAQLLIVFC